MRNSLKKNHGYLWLEIIEYGFISVLLAFLLFSRPEDETFSDWNNFRYTVIGSLFLGMEVMILKLYFFPAFNHLNTLLKVVLKVIVTNIYIFIFLFCYIGYIIYRNDEFLSMNEFLKGNNFLNIQIQAFIISVFLIGFQEIRSLIGKEKLRNYLLGKYQTPSNEERIFMFLDLKGSTTLTEKLGNELYFSLLNDYFNDLTSPILKSRAEIYQYVGDEVVLSWSIKNGLKNSNCLRFYEFAKEKINSRNDYYLNRYNVIPEFKAGLHIGKVVIAQIGQIKKDIIYSGDVLNTTSRMEGLCNTNEANLIISKKLLNQLEPSDNWEPSPLPETQLKGKNEEVSLFKMNLNI